MKRSILTAVVVLSVFGLFASASAGQKNRNRDQNDSNNGNFQKYTQNLGLNNLNGVSNLVSNFKKKGHKHDDNPKPLDPGQGDGRVPVEPVTPQGPPGFVFVDGHWERVRAPKTPTMIVDPIPGSGGVVVRDHRTISQPVVRDHRTTSSPIVRDHRDLAGQGGVFPTTPTVVVRDHRTISQPVVRDHRTPSGPVVRDHRNGAPQGGVTVTTTPGSSRDNAITGSGPNPLELAVDGLAKVGNVFGIGYGSVTPAGGSRDHRTISTQPTVRDHR